VVKFQGLPTRVKNQDTARLQKPGGNFSGKTELLPKARNWEETVTVAQEADLQFLFQPFPAAVAGLSRCRTGREFRSGSAFSTPSRGLTWVAVVPDERLMDQLMEKCE
jgi:hypothetical protein